jgi:hypothetical protein
MVTTAMHTMQIPPSSPSTLLSNKVSIWLAKFFIKHAKQFFGSLGFMLKAWLGTRPFFCLY